MDRTETIFENFDTEAAETQAEVATLDTRDKENLYSIAGALL